MPTILPFHHVTSPLNMKTRILDFILALSLFCFIILASCNRNNDSDIRKTIKEQVKGRIDSQYSVGTMVVFFENGKEEYFSYGFTNTTDKKPVSQKSVFEIGSVTKTFTSLLLADLVVKGKVKLTDPVQMYLPDSVHIPVFNEQRITFADLASHTSGLPRTPDNFNPTDSSNPFIDYGVRDMYAFLNQYKLKKDVGQYEYSNLGVALLAHTLTLISGKSYEEMLAEIICKPLNMNETGTSNQSAYLTTPHLGTKPISHWDMEVFAGAGAIRSNGEDLLKYVKVEMGILPTKLKAAIELTQKPLHDVMPNIKVGLGWQILTSNNDEIIMHSGATGGYRTSVAFSKKKKKAIIILNNSGQSTDDLAAYFFNPDTKFAPFKQAVSVSKSTLQKYTGRYKVIATNDFLKSRMLFEVKLVEDKLHIQLTGNLPVEFLGESDNRFFSKQSDAVISFTKDERGQIDQLVLYQYGQKVTAEKLH